MFLVFPRNKLDFGKRRGSKSNSRQLKNRRFKLILAAINHKLMEVYMLITIVHQKEGNHNNYLLKFLKKWGVIK
jgi:hypothetical protein